MSSELIRTNDNPVDAGEFYENYDQMPSLFNDGPGGEELLKMAQKLVKRQHPMRKTPLVEVLTFLRPISCCFSCCGDRRDRSDNFAS